MRKNPPEFFGSNVSRDPQLYLDEVKKVIQVIHITEEESLELASYKLKDVAYDWVVMWKNGRGENAVPTIVPRLSYH